VTDGDLPRAQIARQTCEPQTSANIASQVDYEPVAILLLYFSNSEIEVVCEADASRSREIRNPEQADPWLDDRVPGAAWFDYGRTLRCPFTERYFDLDLSLVLTLGVGYSETVRRADAERGHVRRYELDAIYGEQRITPPNAGELCRACLKHIQKVPMLLSVLAKGSERGTDRMLWQEPVRSLVVEDGMAAAKFLQRFPDALFELIDVPCEQESRSVVKSSRPFVIIYAADVEMAFQNALPYRGQNRRALLLSGSFDFCVRVIHDC
jgi:hypothetical protein